MTKYTDEEWEEIGGRWRQAAQMDSLLRLNAPNFIRWLKHAGYIKDYVCLPDVDLPDCEGKFDPDKEIIFYRVSTWQAAEEGLPHAIWTLVHEGCHAISGHREIRLRATAVASKLKLFSRRTQRDETEADRLTACILAPFNKADFKLGTSSDDLMRRFGLSRIAAEIRLEQFERLYRRMHGLPRELPPGVIDFLSKQKRDGFTVTSIGDDLLPKQQTHCQYEGDACPNCNEFKLIRLGLNRRCDNCGATTGDD
jgi:Zn-dependent peptidase ImmA (M78 family)